MSEEIVLFGLTQTADIIQYYLHKYTNYKVVARCVDEKYITCKEYEGLPVVPFETVENYYSPSKYKMSIPMYRMNLNRVREEKYLSAKQRGYNLISYISPNAEVETNDIGENTYILGQASIHPFVKIGNNCIIWPGTIVGHHGVIEDNCFLSAPLIGGRVNIQQNTSLGLRATIRDGVKIGKYCFIGMCANVQKDLPDFSIVSVKNSKKWKVNVFEAEEFLK